MAHNAWLIVHGSLCMAHYAQASNFLYGLNPPGFVTGIAGLRWHPPSAIARLLTAQCAPLPCLINTQPFSGLENLEKLASLASTSEKLVSKTRLEKSGAQQPNAFSPNKSHKSLPIGNFDVDDIPHI